MVADIAIHDKLDGNPHAHIMLTMRSFEEDGSWGSKSKKQYLLDQEGKKIYTEKGNPKSIKIDTTDWNKKETLERWRENWANTCNKHLEKSDITARIDHRSYSDQGIDKLPTVDVHLGYVANAMERRGIPTERGEQNRLIRNLNQKIEEILNQIKNLFRQRIEIIRSVEPTTVAEKKSYLTRQNQKHLPAVKHLNSESIEFLYKLNKNRGKPHSIQELKEIYTKKGKLLKTDPSPENSKDLEGIRDFMDDLKRAHLTERSEQAELKPKINVLSRSFELGD
ncbi:MAG: MobA/MobL family protein [Clostridia bacterium]|nr:MobA/MobL family protein [Clostridia bacterium]